MSSVARTLTVLAACCCCCCVSIANLEEFNKQHGMYAHVGVQVLLCLDGMIALDPCFVDDQYLRQSKYICCSTAIWKNHQMKRYMKALETWIDQVHPGKADMLKGMLMDKPDW